MLIEIAHTIIAAFLLAMVTLGVLYCIYLLACAVLASPSPRRPEDELDRLGAQARLEADECSRKYRQAVYAYFYQLRKDEFRKMNHEQKN